MPGYRHSSLTPRPAPGERMQEAGFGLATVYEVGVLEPGAVATRPVPIASAEFQRAFRRLSEDVRLGAKTPREAASELLSLSRQLPPEVQTVESAGDWLLEAWRGRGYTLVPERQAGPVSLTPEADEALKRKYLAWCEHQGGGDCLGVTAQRR